MPKFSKRPVVIEAEQFLGHGGVVPEGCESFDPDIVAEIMKQRGCVFDTDGNHTCGAPLTKHAAIRGVVSRNFVCPMDWVITGVVGGYFPCKPNRFEATYKPVDGGDGG